ncbi:galactose/methyl galactoside import ATP-binding protein MglA [Desulfosporosinus acididurans]|uniref:Galactose/methyl galactoside import ATP-binding protein MglA n=1 Tax=Desulfosporosinus acididurans TaxID=476652 RepID=A0A0J1FN19_9FIRM|nr:ABC transporter ATP-binding protein [Desulfosporosinus acididurans]KLU64737.1 galactose/methyl galactoside import ATP-binding protein MglA [Desulfosporosinus acididurans]
MVEMRKITKEFPGILANDQVSLVVNKGEIHALLGENGAGKSTLMSVLTGLYRPDGGEIFIEGKRVEFSSPKDAVKKGIGMVHQHFKLVQPFTVAENIMLSIKELKQIYNLKEIERQIIGQSEAFGLSIDPKAKIWQLSVGEQQRVEIIKLLLLGAEFLILDEPTAVLTPQEAKALYTTLQKMAVSGKSIVIISHKMNEVMENTNSITVLRDGRSIGTVQTKTTNEKELAKMMVGRNISSTTGKTLSAKTDILMTLANVSALGDNGLLKLKNISMDIYKGEILGIAGVDGNGQKELAETVAGLRSAKQGAISFCGKDCTKSGRKKRINLGISYVPEDRMTTGLVTELNAYENVALKSYRKYPGPFISWDKVKHDSEQLIEKFDVRLASMSNPVKMMSGGNIQKLLLAREIESNPKLIIAVYPMRGLDIGATDYVRRLLIGESEKGITVLLISEDLEDILSMTDRIIVMHGGEIMGVVKPNETSREEIGLMMAGKRKVDLHEA